MKKILLFPLLQIPSGHHHVADALINGLENQTDEIQCKKIDLLSHINPKFEKMISSFYLNWIHHFPSTYEVVYKKFGISNHENQVTNHLYKLIFLKKMEQLIQKENPDLIICTHGFPSLLLDELKQKGKIKTPVVNVYTDFFINQIWGRESIDFHFVPTKEVKEMLLTNGVSENKIYVTGIPIDPIFKTKEAETKNKDENNFNILISGGSSGLGAIHDLINKAKENHSKLNFMILCGNNKKLYQDLVDLDSNRIVPFTYLSSKEEVNDLYNQADAIILKPGGVTVSEALTKQLPIFVHSYLPGQESINLKYLQSKQLVYLFDWEKPIDEQLLSILKNTELQNKTQEQITSFLSDMQNPTEILIDILENETYLKTFKETI